MAKEYAGFIDAPLATTSAIDNKGVKELFKLAGDLGLKAASENQRAKEESRIKIEKKKKEE